MLRFLKAKRSDEALAVAADVDVGHVTRVVDPRLSLQVVPAWILMIALIHVVLSVQRLLPLALVDRVETALAVQILLAWHR